MDRRRLFWSPAFVAEFYHLVACGSGLGPSSLSVRNLPVRYLLVRPLWSGWLFIYLEQPLPSSWLSLCPG